MRSKKQLPAWLKEPLITSSTLRLDPHLVTMLVISASTLWWLALTLQNSHFYADDLEHFVHIGEMSLAAFLLQPIDVHTVPLHRLSTYLIYTLAPYNFALAVTVLLSFHLGALYLLYRILGKLFSSNANYYLLIVMGSYIFFIDTLIWWSAGIHRLPFVFLSLLAIYLYLHLREQGGWKLLCGIALAQLTALGFFSKAVLIPGYLLAIELCLLFSATRGSFPERVPSKRLWSVAALLLTACVTIAYIAWYLHTSPQDALATEWSAYIAVIREMFSVQLHSLFGTRLAMQEEQANLLIYALAALLFFYSLLRSVRNTMYWAILVAIVAANFSMIALTSRTRLFGVESAYIYRYYYDSLFLMLIVAAFMINEPAHHRLTRRLSLVCSNWFSSRAAAGAAVAVFALLYTGLSLSNSHRHVEMTHDDHQAAHRYLHNLLPAVRSLEHGEPVPITDGLVPLEVYGGFLRQPMPFSVFLPTLPARFQFSLRGDEIFAIDEQGRLSQYAIASQQPIPLVDAYSSAGSDTSCLSFAENVAVARNEALAPPEGKGLLVFDYSTQQPEPFLHAQVYHNVRNVKDGTTLDDEAVYRLTFDRQHRQKAVLVEQPLLTPAFRFYVNGYDPSLCISNITLYAVEKR